MKRTLDVVVGAAVLMTCAMGAAFHVQAQTLATGDSRTVTQPTYPSVCETIHAQFSSSQRAAPPASDDTSRLQSALTSCAGTGASVVLASSGSNNAFYSNTLNIKGEALVLNSGVTLYGSNSYANNAELLYVTGKNAAIMGPGAIDGRGDLITGTPRLVQSNGATSFTVYNVTLQQAAKMHLYVEGGSGFTAWGVNIRTPATVANTDGIDIDSITNATVTQSSIEAGDDGIAVKTNSAATSNVTVSNTRLYGTHGLSIGSQTMYGISNVLFKNNDVYGQDLQGTYSTNNNAINIKTDPTCGGTVQQVTYQNTCIKGGRHLIILNTAYGQCAGKAGIPQFSNIVIDGVYSTGSQSGSYSKFYGYSAQKPISAFLGNVQLDAPALSTSQYANVGVGASNLTPAGTGVNLSSYSPGGSVPSCSF